MDTLAIVDPLTQIRTATGWYGTLAATMVGSLVWLALGMLMVPRWRTFQAWLSARRLKRDSKFRDFVGYLHYSPAAFEEFRERYNNRLHTGTQVMVIVVGSTLAALLVLGLPEIPERTVLAGGTTAMMALSGLTFVLVQYGLFREGQVVREVLFMRKHAEHEVLQPDNICAH